MENYKYPTKEKQVRADLPDASTTKSKEIVFVCLVQRFGCHNKKYYISEEYNLLADSNESSGEYAAGRFIFKKRRGHVKSLFLYGLAELPGTAFTSPEYDTERLYLQRRKNHHGISEFADLIFFFSQWKGEVTDQGRCTKMPVKAHLKIGQ